MHFFVANGIHLNNIRAVRGKISGGPGNWARRQAEKREKIVGGGEKVEKKEKRLKRRRGIRKRERGRGKGKERKGKREEGRGKKSWKEGRRRNKIHGLFFRPMAFGGYGGVGVKSPQALTTCGDSCPILQIGLGLLHFFYDCLERLWVVYGEVGQNFSGDFDACLVECSHEL